MTRRPRCHGSGRDTPPPPILSGWRLPDTVGGDALGPSPARTRRRGPRSCGRCPARRYRRHTRLMVHTGDKERIPMSLDLHGIIPPLVTPFTDDEEIDADAMRREVRYLLDAGVHGLTVTGSTGEGHTLTLDESCRIAQVAIEETHGAVPVVGGIIQDSTRAVLRYGWALKEVG